MTSYLHLNTLNNLSMNSYIKNISKAFFIALVLLISNSSAQWTAISGSFINISIKCLALQKNDSSGVIIYVGTNLEGVYVSKDSGITWQHTNLVKSINSISVQKTAVFAATGTDGIYRSMDEGSSWAKVSDTSGAKLITSDSVVYMYTSYGVYRSSDQGENWTICSFPQNYISTVSVFKDRMVVVSNDSIYYSDDAGKTSELVNTSLVLQGINCSAINNTKIFIGTNNGIFMSADNGSLWYERGETRIIDNIACEGDTLLAVLKDFNIFYSTDNGASWEPTSLNNVGAYFISAIGANVITVASSGNIYYSIDLGRNWEWINATIQSQKLHNLAYYGSYIYVVNYDRGVYRSRDNGKNWIAVNPEPFDYFIQSILANQYGVYVGTGSYVGGKYPKPYGSIYYSSDNGANWTKSINSDYFKSSLFVEADIIIAGTANNFYGGDVGGVYISTDGGINWNYNNFKTTDISSFSKFGSSILAGGGDGLFVSADNGLSWSKISNIPSIVIATDGSKIYIGNNNGIYASKDSGATFQQTGTYPTASIEIYKNDIYICGSAGLYRSENYGSTWLNVSTDGIIFSKIAIKDDNILGFDNVGGIYTAHISDIIVSVEANPQNIPLAYKLQQNYPNPFNPTTRISYEIPKSSFVTIKVYDVLGREVTTLVNEEKTAGIYSVQFNGSNLASGIYFYRIQAGDFVQTNKLVLMK